MTRSLARLTIALLFVGMTAVAANARSAPPRPLPVEPSATPQVEVLWQGIWWDATVVNERGNKVKIHYIGWGSGWDEWVGQERFRSANLVRLRTARKGQAVEINWRGGWWPGKVLRGKNGRYKITYDNYGAEWDEWVTPKRLRAPHRPVA